MKMQKLLLFLTIFIFCNGISKTENSFFPKKISLQSEVINNNKITEFGIVKVIDSLLLIYNLGASSEEKLFHLYSKNTFLQMASTKNFIYSQYFGIEAMGKEHPNKLNVFDWNGNPIAQIELDVDIMSFALDLENKRIIAYSNSETPLVYYDFDENELIK